MLRRLLVFMGMIVAVVLSFKYCEFKKGDDSAIDYNTNLIQQQIVNVGKLVVTEGHFSVVTYKNKEEYLMGMVSFDKKALLTLMLLSLMICIK
jgi:hypothetical protein